MTESGSSTEAVAQRKGFSLSTKLVVLVAGTLLVVAAVALAVLLPQSRQQFIDRTEDLVVTTHDGMLDVTTTLIENDQTVVVALATHISDTYARELADIPLRLAGGDESKIRSMILEQVGELRRRTIQNVEVIGEELGLRSESDVAAAMEQQRRVQGEKGEQFARSLQRRSLGVALFLILAPLPVLLAGLYRMVVRPVTQLAAATTRARRGDLEFHLPVTARDEIGSLQESFNRMIQDLSQWNATLEQRVEEKTLELRQALEDQNKTTRRLQSTVAELQCTQNQLVHAEKMAGLGHLSASVAHEFNNLLGGILGSAQAALEEKPGGTVGEALEVVRRAARRACVITDNLLRFSRKEEPHKSPGDLNRLVEECVQLLEPEMRKRRVSVDVALDELPSVPIDSGQMHQVLLNLLSNATYAVEPGGNVYVSTEVTDDTVLLSVADDGPGIAAADRHRVFEPFFSTRGAGDDRPAGTGLGLSVSYGIITGHGGSITVDDHPGGGARFQVRLPLDGAAEAPA